MTSVTYNWRRYWIPRDGGFSFDSQGFLQPPASDLVWARHWKTDVVEAEGLLSKPCLVLLGEPGIGKTHSIHATAERTMQLRLDAGAAVLKRDLSSYSSDQHLVEDVFRSDEFLRWKQTGSELHVFLDSFDECLLRVDTVAELIAEQLGRSSSVQNLFFRVASRTAEWRTSLEDALKRHWGEQSVGVYELAPLTRDQVLEAARVQLSTPDHFVKEVVAGEVSFRHQATHA